MRAFQWNGVIVIDSVQMKCSQLGKSLDGIDESLEVFCGSWIYPSAELAFGESTVDENGVMQDGVPRKNVAAEQVESLAFCYMSPVGQPFLMVWSVGGNSCG
jgi:hypothetical protein